VIAPQAEPIAVPSGFGEIIDSHAHVGEIPALGLIDPPEKIVGLRVFGDAEGKMNLALADVGGSLLVIEHNLDLIAEADWIIDLGPEGGAGGGRIVAEGSPEQIARNKSSHTGRFLAKVLRSR